MFRLLLSLSLATISASSVTAQDGGQPNPIVHGTKMVGVYHGTVEIWANPSFKRAEGEYRHGDPDGKWTFWDEAGIKILEINYQIGAFYGSFTMWYNAASGPDYRGKLKSRGSFLDGMWQGSILTYYPNGKLRSERIYVDGVVHEALAYEPQGKGISKEESMKIAMRDEEADNAFVDAIDAYIRQWAG